MNDKVASYNIISRRSKITEIIAGVFVFSLFTSMALFLFFQKSSSTAYMIGSYILGTFVFVFDIFVNVYGIDDMTRRLIITDEDLYIYRRYKKRSKYESMTWGAIEKLMIKRSKDGNKIIYIQIIGKYPIITSENYDFKLLPFRNIITIPGDAPDMQDIMQRLEERVPDLFEEEYIKTASQRIYKDFRDIILSIILVSFTLALLYLCLALMEHRSTTPIIVIIIFLVIIWVITRRVAKPL